MDTHLTESCFRKMGGAYAALFTPYDAKGRVNPETIAKIVDYGLANGLNGFYLTGTTGEWWLLSLEERKLVMDAAVRAAKGRCKLIAHDGAGRRLRGRRSRPRRRGVDVVGLRSLVGRRGRRADAPAGRAGAACLAVAPLASRLRSPEKGCEQKV